MPYANGRLPDSALAPIPGGRLREDAARAFNAMNAESEARYGVTLHPLGPNSSYRTLAMQQMMKRLYGANAATVGTSNHGLGLAVDLATRRMRWIVDQIGHKYGWAKEWSDASWEWWHLKWRPGAYPAVKAWAVRTRLLRPGQHGPGVKRLQRILRAHGFKSVKASGYFGEATTGAVKRVQRKHNLKPDGVVGPATWRALGVR